jgi:hypothetical protein
MGRCSPECVWSAHTALTRAPRVRPSHGGRRFAKPYRLWHAYAPERFQHLRLLRHQRRNVLQATALCAEARVDLRHTKNALQSYAGRTHARPHALAAAATSLAQ